MIPIALDPTRLAVAVAGQGPLAWRRFQALRAAGARNALLFCPNPTLEMATAALRNRLPDAADLAALRVLWITGLPDAHAATLAEAAESARVLVNVEDRRSLCAFHSVAELRRGDLLLTVSTGGASPGLAQRIRGRLAAEYGPEWAGRLALLAASRDAWRRGTRDLGTLARLTDELLETQGWLA
ncbi:MAG: siroheme synthase [Rhodospirillales bacterium 70-18]|nr:MAG: siroheme synthase [Rhodospirillales bacterium 70-18]